MPLSYDVDKRFKGISEVLDEHADWYVGVVRNGFFNGVDGVSSPKKPDSFLFWVKDVSQEDFIDKTNLSRLVKLHDDMIAAADLLMGSAIQGKTPELEKFNTLSTLFEEFILQFRRLEKDCALEDSGLDALTGLRSRHVMDKDLAKELDRLERKGKPFSLALARIDKFEEIVASCDQQMVNACEKLVGSLIKKSVRSFDDAYRSDAGEFVLSLKQAESRGAIAALERLRTELENQNTMIDLKDGRKIGLTMSCCIASPIPGDQVHELIENLRLDLGSSEKPPDAVLEYYEVSPLQRFIKEEQ